MINEETYRQSGCRYCSEPLENIENYRLAVESPEPYEIHHRLEIREDGTQISRDELIKQGLYYDRPASELVFLTWAEHMRLHSRGNSYHKGHKHTVQTKAKCGAANIGRMPWNKGGNHSEEAREKMSKAKKGRHWITNGLVEMMIPKDQPIPQTFKEGRLRT